MNQICEDVDINLHKFFEYQDKDTITLSEDEKRLIDDYRRLEHEQAIRVKAYLDGLLDLQGFIRTRGIFYGQKPLYLITMVVILQPTGLLRAYHLW